MVVCGNAGRLRQNLNITAQKIYMNEYVKILPALDLSSMLIMRIVTYVVDTQI